MTSIFQNTIKNLSTDEYGDLILKANDGNDRES